MVGILHARGYQRLRICPGLSASGAYWRCSVTPVTNVLKENGAKFLDWDTLSAHYTTSQRLKFFGWDDADSLTPDQMADRFIERFPDISAAGHGADWAYAGWYQDMLRLTQPDAFPIAYSDYFDSDVGGLPCLGGNRAEELVVPYPPPGQASAEDDSGIVKTQAQLQSVSTLLVQYGDILEELRRRKVVRSTNNPAADYAEGLVAKALGLALVEGSNKGYDAVSTDKRRYQIKCRRITAHNKSRQLSQMRNMKGDPFDFLVGVLFAHDFSVMRAAIVPISVVLTLAKYVAHTNSWRFLLRDEIWAVPGVEDITLKIREAQASEGR
jgi:hypothetical protein